MFSNPTQLGSSQHVTKQCHYNCFDLNWNMPNLILLNNENKTIKITPKPNLATSFSHHLRLKVFKDLLKSLLLCSTTVLSVIILILVTFLDDVESPLDCKEIQPVHSERDQPWDIFGGNDPEAELQYFLATSWEELTHWKRLWCWEELEAGGEGDDWGWERWMASPTQWAWVWINSRSWWWTGRPGMLRFMGSQRVRHDWATELKWCHLKAIASILETGG